MLLHRCPARLVHRQLCVFAARQSPCRAINPRAFRASASSAAAPSSAAQASQHEKSGGPRKAHRQTVDYSGLAASAAELKQHFVPAKVEQVLMSDKTTLMLRLRTAALQTAWLLISWHPVAGRVSVTSGPPGRGAAAEAYSLADMASSNLSGLVLTEVDMPQAWERVLRLQFGQRPGDPPSRSVYCEVMSRFSNIILTRESGEIMACGYQVSPQTSSLRPLQAGSMYQPPPVITGIPADACSSLEEWRSTITRAAQLAAASRQQRKRKGTAGSPNSGTAASSSCDSAGNDSGDATSTSSSAADVQRMSSNGAGSSNTNNNTTNNNNNSSSSTSSNTEQGPSQAPSHAAQSPADAAQAGMPEDGQLSDGILRAFQGTSPSLIGDMCLAAGIQHASPDSLPGSVRVGALSDKDWEALWNQWQFWLERVHSGSYAACSDQELSRYSVVWGEDAIPQLSRKHESVLALLDAYYGEMQSDERHARLHQQLLSAVQGLHKKAASKIRTFEAQLADVSKVHAVQKNADLITANLYRIPSGAKEVECEDWDTGEKVTLPLDPIKTPVEVTKDLYKRARKLRRASDAIEPLLEAAHEDLAYIEQVLDSLQQLSERSSADDERALVEVQEELVNGGYMKPPPDAALAAKAASKARKANARASKKGRAPASPDGSSGLRVFTSPGGYKVLVGRNNKQNDVLSHSVAQPEDLWFHVRGRPGSHVALRVSSRPGSGPGPELGDEDVQCAADLASFFSKGRSDLKCDVIVAKAGSLKKPKGAKPGQVLVTKELGNVVGRPGNVEAAVAKEGAVS